MATCRKRMMTTPFAIEERPAMFSKTSLRKLVARLPCLPLLHSLPIILNTVLRGGPNRSTRTQSWAMMNLVRIKRSPTRQRPPCFKLPSTRPEMLCIYYSRRPAGVRTFTFKITLRVLLVSLPGIESLSPRANSSLRGLSQLSRL